MLTMEPLESSSGVATVDECNMEVPIIDDMRDTLEYKGNLVVLQAQVLLEDANYFRSVHHKLDSTSLRIYRIYHSWPIQILLGVVLATNHLLVLIEAPSSLSWNADLRIKDHRVEVPCWVVLLLEICCLFILVIDCCCKTYLIGEKRAFRNPWLMTYIATLFVSIVDWIISTSMLCGVFRFRRFLRPLFLLQHSSIMKKTIKCLRNSLAEVISVLLFLAILIYLFTLVGMCIFPTINPNITFPTPSPSPETSFFDSNSTLSGNSTPSPTPSPSSTEGIYYFRSFWDSLFSLLVLVTTANNPDIMMPIYNQNRFYALYFIIYVVIGLYCLTNMLTAVIYNQFRGYFLSSIQTQLFRRRVAFRAAYSVLINNQEDLITSLGTDTPSYSFYDGLPVFVIRKVVPGIHIPMWKREQIMTELRTRSGCALNYSQFSEVMAIMDETSRPRIQVQPPPRQGRFSQFLQQLFRSRWFDHFGMLVCAANIVVITVEITLRYDIFTKNQDIELEYINAVFIAFYLFEQVCKLWANGFDRYLSDKWNLFDLLLTIVLVIMEIVQVIFVYSNSWLHPQDDDIVGLSFWDGARIVNMLIVIRFVRIVPRINSIRLVSSTISDLTLNLKSFAGVLLTAYYVFGLLGMELFGGVITYEGIKNDSKNLECGTYAQLQYWSNNFDDFAAATVTLWDLMVVNNWHVIVRAYVVAVGPWAHVYFVVWWLISVLVIINLVVALIIENFIQRWDKSTSTDLSRDEQFRSLSLYAMFKQSLQEPLQEELLMELKKHPEITGHSSFCGC